ncbi:MAG: hypothetical protein GXO29_03515 [Thermotogae bacterium]|nr:hypothetical protein [Thermotogota bacterium]
MVLAFYYIWFGEDGSRWKVSADKPTMGAYVSTDAHVVREHCRMAKEAGIDGFIVSLWQEEVFGGINRARQITEILEECGLKYTFYVENGDVVERVKEILRVFGERRNLLRVGGKPLIFIYSRINPQLVDVKRRLKLQSLSDVAVISLHDFNGLNGFTSGSMHTYIDFKNDGEYFREMCDYTHAFGGLCAVPVSPGFNLKTRPKAKVPRRGGETYLSQWRRALYSGADIVLITSFNEWEEGTQIEPSESYGSHYLNLTRMMAERFKAAVRGPLRSTFSPPKVRTSKSVCYMPARAPRSPTYLVLPGRELSSGQYPSGCDVVIYDFGEKYFPNDVYVLLRYVRRGGTLLLAGGPFPMYRKGGGKAEPAVGRFGLRIGFGPDLRGKYRTASVKGRYRTYRYYAVGETRLRTLENPDVSLYGLYLAGKPLGTVVGERGFGGGKVMYLWRGVGEQPYLPEILREILR